MPEITPAGAMVTIGYSRLTEVIAKELWRDRTCASPLVTAASQRARRAEPLQPAGWIPALHLDSTVPFEALTAVLEDGVLWQMKSYEKSDREVHFDRQTGKMLGWFIEHRPSRVTRLFGTIIGRAETELDVPREVTTRSLRSSIRMDGGFGEKTDQLDEFLDLVSPPRR